MLNNNTNLFRKIKQIGYKKISKILKNRLQSKAYKLLYSKNFTQKILLNKKINSININFIDDILNLSEFESFLPKKFNNQNYVIKKADQYCCNCFNILNSGLVCFEQNNINWQNPKNTFDIKAPWELSRFNHAVFLGKAYQITKDEKYTKAFTDQVTNWIETNRFLTGINWICPMDVSIRAINFLWGYNYFKNSPNIKPSFFNNLKISLYQHKSFLKNNFEIFIKNNNHYLADLIGYFYLLIFFKQKKLAINLSKKILTEFDLQVLPDGVCYEGSTNYHKLVTELFLHFYLLCKVEKIELPENFLKKFNKMLLFLDQASDNNNLIQIGDNDSGKIVFGLSMAAFINPFDFALKGLRFRLRQGFDGQAGRTPLTKSTAVRPECSEFYERNRMGTNGTPQIFHKKYFGLTIIKDKNFHITYRHPTYQNNQPTGHFHQDRLAVTLSILGQQVLIDPGTYVYTANPKIRNILRSINSHNTFYLKNESKKENPKNFDLFILDKQKHKDSAKIKFKKEKIYIKNVYEKGFAKYKRILILNSKKKLITIKDYIEQKKETSDLVCWNFIFHPKIKIEKKDTKNFWLNYKDQNLGIFNSTLMFKKKDFIYSPAYGKLIKTNKLKSCVLINKFIYHKSSIKLLY